MSKILFVFEGKKTEKQIADSLSKYFVATGDKVIIKYAFCAEIYQLYKLILEDEYLDIFTLLKNKSPENENILKDYDRNDFAEIYLFFDYDGHSSLADDDKLLEMLELFNEETEFGKLYISYPMVESLKHYSDKIDFKNLKVLTRNNTKYKDVVGKSCDFIYQQFSRYTIDIWKKLIEIHLMKMNYILYDEYTFPIQNCSQGKIFAKQREKYIDMDSSVAVLSAFPIFLLDYYGVERLLEKCGKFKCML